MKDRCKVMVLSMKNNDGDKNVDVEVLIVRECVVKQQQQQQQLLLLLFAVHVEKGEEEEEEEFVLNLIHQLE
jgi:hypothetical protein